MATLDARVAALEKSTNTAPMMTMCIDTAPTPAQQATIDHCTRTGHRLVMFCMPGDTAWMPGYGVPPWEVDHAHH